MSKMNWKKLIVGVIPMLGAVGMLNTGCASTEQESADEHVGVAEQELTAAQCNYFAQNGKVQICHRTASQAKPYTILKVSEQACVNAHALHAGDYVAVNDPNCQGVGCLPQGAPCDPTVPCCDGFSCVSGTCQANVSDHCNPSPCQNGGSCTNNADGYTCGCPAGYTGTNCETEIDECQSNPCVNGQCLDAINAYECQCDPGFTGTNCETEIDECEAAPCLNGGTCTDGLNSYSCECLVGYTGTNCEVPETPTCRCIDQAPAIWQEIQTLPVDVAACQNGGISNPLGPFASVGPGPVPYTGQTVCYLSSPSTFESILMPISAADADECLAQFADACHDNSCASNPCHNGGTCNSGGTNYGYTCQCSAGWTGTNCDEPVADPCASAPCQNGGTCNAAGSSYTCACQPGFAGTHCEVSCPCDPTFSQIGALADQYACTVLEQDFYGGGVWMVPYIDGAPGYDPFALSTTVECAGGSENPLLSIQIAYSVPEQHEACMSRIISYCDVWVPNF